jgi:ferredoxin
MDVTVDRELCIGSGTCVRLAPGVFTLGNDGIAMVSDAADADPSKLMRAADSCPAGAIFLTRDPTGDLEA